MEVDKGLKGLRRPRYENAAYIYANCVNVRFYRIYDCSCSNYRS